MTGETILAALQTVEQDHQIVLNKIAALKDCIGILLRPGSRDLHPVLHRLKEISDYLETNFTAHLLEEETTLFPLLEQLKPDGPELVGRLRLEHEEIRGMREELSNCLGVAFDLEENLPRAVVRDLLIDAWELWDLLDKHAHIETQAVRECVGRYLHEFGGRREECTAAC